MARYVDGFVLPVPKKHFAAYKKMATLASKVWKQHGAVDYLESVGDDLKIGMGTPFPRAARARKGETVVFSWILYKSKAHRNAVNKKVMKDPRIAAMMNEKMPFDVKRMVMGGFRVFVEI
ncbi:MAG TPA: DUF1428 domain-containing protein [Thermoanaerobaculia bacterium]|jgi:uncharacterized protein YbaA (DUF1428 family)